VRILHVTDTFRPVLGGIEVLVDDLAHHQRLNGHDVTVLTGTPDGEPESDVVRLRYRLANLHRILAAIRPDVVHCHSSIVSPMAWRAARSASTAGIPALVTMHSIVPAMGLGHLAVSMAARTVPAGVSWTAVSQVAAASLQPLVRDPVQILPNGIDVGRCLIAAPGWSSVPTVVSVMRLARRKRPLALVRMLGSMSRGLGGRPWRALVVGDGPQTADMKRHLHAAGLADRVHLTGRLERSQVLKVLSGADLYLAPSRLEAFGLAALEARCSGLPVVAMRSGGVGEFVTHGVHGYLVENDSEMALRAAGLLSDREGLVRMAQASRRDRPDLDWGATVERSVAAYDRVVAVTGHSGRPGRPGRVSFGMAAAG
jgi:glycosyltransferase involved in cell wall biosynthesis